MRRLPGWNTSAKFCPQPSSTAVRLGSFLPLSTLGSGRSAAAVLKKSMTWPISTTGLTIGSFLQNW